MSTDDQVNHADDLPSDAAPIVDKHIWRKRADAYDSQYKGPVHWVRVINVISATGTISVALRETGLSRVAFNHRRERYEEFAEAVDEAMQYFREGTLERAALTRAVDGVLEPVFYKGTQCGFIRKYSDTLLTKLLEGNMPEKYRNKAENTAPGSITITGGLPPDEEESPPVPGTPAAQPPARPDEDPLGP